MTRHAAALAVLLAGLLAAAPGALAGQGTGRLFFSGGVQVVDTDPLNRLLEERGQPTLDDEHVTIGVGLDHQTGSWLVGGEAMLLLDQDADGEGFERSLGGRYALVEAGPVIPLVGGLRVYPLAGIGLSDLELSTSRDESVPFEEILDSTGASSEASTGGLLLQPGLGVDLVTGGFSLGLRGGYMFRPGEADWEVDDVDIEGGPDVGLEGPFLRASIGLAGG